MVRRLVYFVLLAPILLFSQSVVTGSGVQSQSDILIRLQSGSFDPLAQSSVAMARKRLQAMPSRYFLVQYHEPVSPSDRARLSDDGATSIRFISKCCSLVRSDNLSLLQKLPTVRWAGPLLPSDRISSRFQNRTGHVDLLAACFSDTRGVGRAIKALGGRNLKISGEYLRATLPAAALERAAAIPELEWVEPAPIFQTDNDRVADISEVDQVIITPGLTGLGQTVAIADSGLDTGADNGGVNGDIHLDFDNRVTFFNYAGSSPDDLNGHGTHVTGTVAGNGSNMPQFKGMAPDAAIVFQGLGDDSGSTSVFAPQNLATLFDDAKNAGASIHNDSWGNASDNSYSLSSRQVDDYMWSNPNFLIVYAAGNGGSAAGTISAPGTAKNCITVGASESLRPEKGSLGDNIEQVASFSSRGPTPDGRIKPDVVAPGTWVISTLSSVKLGSSIFGWAAFNGQYIYSGGTSMATPAVSGMAALIRQDYMDNKSVTPSAALIKATLINGTDDLDNGSGTSSIPNNDEGWGRVNIQNSIAPALPTRVSWTDNTAGLNEGGQTVFSVKVIDTSVPLRFSLVWTDFRSATNAATNLVNDLNLTLTDPNGIQYNGNDFVAPFNDAVDAINNVEGVFVTNPVVGVYTITVNALTVAHGPQPFAVVGSGAFQAVGAFVDTSVVDFNQAESTTHLLVNDTEGAGNGSLLTVTTPVDFQPGTITAASSELPPGFVLGNAYDNDLSTLWASAGSGPATDQWITIDLGTVTEFDRVALHPGDSDWSLLTGNGNPTFIPTDFRIETSTDNIAWTTVLTRTGYVAPPEDFSRLLIPKTSARYVRFYGLAAGMTWFDGNSNDQQDSGELFHVGIADLFVWLAGTGSVIESSSTFDAPHDAAAAGDGVTTTFWSSVGNNPMQTETITVDLGAVSPIGSVRIYSGDSNFSASTNTGDDTFTPIDFEIRTSNDNASWVVVKTVTGLSMAQSTWKAFQFTPTTGRYVQIAMTNTPFFDQNGNGILDPEDIFYATFGEIEVLSFADVAIAASSNNPLPTFGDPMLSTDGDLSTLWASAGTAILTDQSVTVDMGQVDTTVYGVRLYSGPIDTTNNTIGNVPSVTPIDFVIETSNDTISWTPKRIVTGHTQAAATWSTWIMGPTSARYIRIRGTNLVKWDTNNNGVDDAGDLYYMALGEIELLRNRNEGELVSRVIDTGVASTWDRITWDAVIPIGGTVLVQTRSGNSTDLSTENWFPTQPGEFYDPNGANAIVSPAGRYIQYRIRLFSSNVTTTPIVHSVTITTN